MNIIKQKRKESGFCVNCGKHPLINKNECSLCRDNRQLKYKERWHNGNAARQFKEKRNLRIKHNLCVKCGKNKALETHLECENCFAKYQQNYYKWKDEAYDGYGGYVCNCCGETMKEFLTLDHINNDGAHHRRKTHAEKGNISATRGRALYRWIVRNNHPPIFQVLCYNCNCGKQINGGVCPHKKSNAKLIDESSH